MGSTHVGAETTAFARSVRFQRQPHHHPAQRPGKAALPQCRADQRHRRPLDQPLWQALTDPAFTNRYWGAGFDTDWRPGSEMVWHQRDWTGKDPEQVVLEAEPYRRLSYTWHTFDPAFAATFEMDPDDVAAWAREPRSKVTFEIEPQGEVVELAVVHDGFEPGSQVLRGISGGWPSILSNLKTLLETGRSLPDPVTAANS
ncbi:SRPBCC family protein [Nocardia gipuzkoensis]